MGDEAGVGIKIKNPILLWDFLLSRLRVLSFTSLQKDS